MRAKLGIATEEKEKETAQMNKEDLCTFPECKESVCSEIAGKSLHVSKTHFCTCTPCKAL